MIRPLCLSLGVVLAGCATTHDAKWSEPVAATQGSDEARALAAEGDAAWAQRDDRAKLEEAIAKWESAAQSWADGALDAKLARAWYWKGDAFLSLDSDAQARDDAYTRSLEWATRAVKIDAPGMASAFAGGAQMQTAVKLADAKASEALLWYATSLGKWAAQRQFATRVKYKDQLKAIVDRVHEIDPSQHGATFRWLGTYEAQTIGIAGGNPDRAKADFEQSLQVAPHFLGTRVLWAEYLCPKTHDRQTFKKLLEEVIAADPTLDPNNVPENREDQRKAQKLLAQIDSLF